MGYAAGELANGLHLLRLLKLSLETVTICHVQ